MNTDWRRLLSWAILISLALVVLRIIFPFVIIVAALFVALFVADFLFGGSAAIQLADNLAQWLQSIL